VFALGCSSSEEAASPVADSSPADSSVSSDSSDATGPGEAGEDATSETSDASDSSADVVADASDSAPVDADASETTSCDYVDLDDVLVKCGGKYALLGYFDVDPAAASCPPYWGFGGKTPHYATKDAAIAGQGCDATCVWTFATAVTRLYCGHKDGYETLKASGCPDVYRFAEGYYESVEAHDAANPCP
jgi:hypothetical protein